MKRIIFSLLFFLFLISCKKNKEDINMSLLHLYYYIDFQVNEDINIKNNDTVRLSFENNDTLKILYFQYGVGQVLNKLDTGYLAYSTEDNKIFFGWFLDKLDGVNYGLASGTWDIQVLNPDTLIVTRVSNNGDITGHFGYSTIKK
jgi:hypothetical protein